MKINSIIFDMDGVIIDSEPQWAKAQIDTLAEFDVVISEQDCERLTRGKRIDEIARIWIQIFHLNAEPLEVAESILQKACAYILKEGRAMLGLYELLGYLKSHNIRMAVATSSAPIIIQAVFDKLNLWDYFVVQCSANDELYGKPHPAVYLRTIEKLGISATECIVIEDSVVGLIAAKAANLCTFLVNASYQNECFAIADARMPSLLEVLKKLEIG
ncbi:HAD-IA family hydrolase [[Haemophilus] felis]|nr:HAD-IA family hydrolase [[Haemophilus] felis]